MPTFDDGIRTFVDSQLKSADRWADFFRGGNVVLAVIIAGLGAMVAAKPDFGVHTSMVLGVLTAMFGALNKAVDPGEAGEKYATRKRALELLKVEVDREDSGSPLTKEDVKRLAYRSKRDPSAVLEEIVGRTAKASPDGNT